LFGSFGVKFLSLSKSCHGYGTTVFDFLQFVWTKLVVKGQGGFNEQRNCPIGSNLENQEQVGLDGMCL
jgi:hypothetical protein